MKRERLTPRHGWQAQLEAVGFYFHSLGGVYWDESACYRFAAFEIDMLEEATAELHKICLAAVQSIVERRAFDTFALDDWLAELVTTSWNARAPSLYGRFDLRYDGINSPKLLEYNADTPTSLIEAAVAQWNWLQAVHPKSDQFNSIHEKLIARWETIKATVPGIPPVVHFTCVKDSDEDLGNLDYLRDTAVQAGIEARHIYVDDIGWSEGEQCFVDLDMNPIRALFKLYPWEWMMRDEFGPNLPRAKLAVFEPAWKILLSCKAILPILWELNPGHPNLLPTYFDAAPLGERYVRKPLYSREGANVEIHGPRGVFAQPGTYGAEGYVYQGYSPLPEFDGNYPVIGSWIIADEPAGMGIREDATPVTGNTSRFVPHYFD
ncbi:MAG TPA: glutathionylspermidine synthase family protein [Burkholderiales bacterium]|nr:glutathionylspermidine synthase family protein [Burkholderiales bacterium]